MKEISDKLLHVVGTAEPILLAIDAADSVNPVLPGGWSRKQVLGHLIDSASNNHQRFVRAALEGSLQFPSYDQGGNVRLQDPQGADWPLLVSLWSGYNRYLAHIISRLPESRLDSQCRVGSGDAVTLRFLVSDYLAHLVHHLRQIEAVDQH